jgi:hypothetical protein
LINQVPAILINKYFGSMAVSYHFYPEILPGFLLASIDQNNPSNFYSLLFFAIFYGLSLNI